jgi:hypothetical protein
MDLDRPVHLGKVLGRVRHQRLARALFASATTRLRGGVGSRRRARQSRCRRRGGRRRGSGALLARRRFSGRLGGGNGGFILRFGVVGLVVFPSSRLRLLARAVGGTTMITVRGLGLVSSSVFHLDILLLFRRFVVVLLGCRRRFLRGRGGRRGSVVTGGRGARHLHRLARRIGRHLLHHLLLGHCGFFLIFVHGFPVNSSPNRSLFEWPTPPFTERFTLRTRSNAILVACHDRRTKICDVTHTDLSIRAGRASQIYRL